MGGIGSVVVTSDGGVGVLIDICGVPAIVSVGIAELTGRVPSPVLDAPGGCQCTDVSCACEGTVNAACQANHIHRCSALDCSPIA